MVSGGLVGMSKPGNFWKSSLCFDKGLEKLSCFFHTPSFACLGKHDGQTQQSALGIIYIVLQKEMSVKLNKKHV